MTILRLNKYLSQQGICSRREGDELIKKGLVKINGKIVKELGEKINTETDKVEVKNQNSISLSKNKINTNKKIYIMVNKPIGYISSTTSRQGASVLELIPEKYGRLFLAGRLDKDSEGLMILTNDGELANTLMHPRFEHEKEYEVITINEDRNKKDIGLTAENIKKLTTGFTDDGEFMKMKSIIELRKNIYRIVLNQGKKRQIRRMLHKINFKVINLKRVRLGKLHLRNLQSGDFRVISKEQII